MTACRFYLSSLLVLLATLTIQFVCVAQDGPITKVTVLDENGKKITQLEIELQNHNNSMEPAAEPRRIRIDDRANVRFLLRNLSPLDVCSRTPGTPSPTAETPVAESFVTTVAGLGAFSAFKTKETAAASGQMSMQLKAQNDLVLPPLYQKLTTPQCSVQADLEYKQILDVSKAFFNQASDLIGSPNQDGSCNNASPPDQVQLTCEIDAGTRKLADFAGGDYRGKSYVNFGVANNSDFDGVRDSFNIPPQSIRNAGTLQALVDEMTSWAGDLHKKYDFAVSPPDSGSPAPPPTIVGALTVSPTALTFTPSTLKQILQISAGAQPGTFTAIPSSDGGWLLISKTTPIAPTMDTLKDKAPDRGTLALLVSVNPAALDSKTHYASIAITGTGAAKGTTIVNVTFKPDASPSACDLARLREIDEIVDQAKAEMSILSDLNKTIEAAQTSLKTSYMALLKVEDDYKRRLKQNISVDPAAGVLVQQFNLGTDRKATSPGYFSCVNDVDGKTPTTSNISYSLLYQDVPRWSASAGVLTSFQEKKIVGIANQTMPGSNPPVNLQFFGITDSARVQFIPMAYVNYRVFGYKTTHYGNGKEDDLIWTTHISGGFGINPNSGTNQPEFFAGFALGMNRFMFHSGVHYGRTQSLAGGYTLGSPVPSGLTTVPISWSYHPAFSIGFSVRLAPF